MVWPLKSYQWKAFLPKDLDIDENLNFLEIQAMVQLAETVRDSKWKEFHKHVTTLFTMTEWKILKIYGCNTRQKPRPKGL